MRPEIRVAIVGVGNCASALVQGIHYYASEITTEGLAHPKIGKYRVSDIKIVAAFDVDMRKVGKDLAKAIFSEPNCTVQFMDIDHTGVPVCKGSVLDGVAPHMREMFPVDEGQPVSNVVEVLRESEAEMLICYLPVGSSRASRFYAEAALEAGIGFVNAIPEFICSDDKWIQRFESRKLLCAGDDIKSQVGATIVHRVIARLIQDRGHVLKNTYQLNIGGNTDFKNMLDEERLESKRISKTRAVLSILDDADRITVRIGPSDFVPQLKDNKVAYMNFNGLQFGGVPFQLDVKLSVEDSPNSAGVMVDVIRCMRIAKDRGLIGYLDPVSAFSFKSPRYQYRDADALTKLEEFIAGASAT